MGAARGLWLRSGVRLRPGIRHIRFLVSQKFNFKGAEPVGIEAEELPARSTFHSGLVGLVAAGRMVNHQGP